MLRSIAFQAKRGRSPPASRTALTAALASPDAHTGAGGLTVAAISPANRCKWFRTMLLSRDTAARVGVSARAHANARSTTRPRARQSSFLLFESTLSILKCAGANATWTAEDDSRPPVVEPDEGVAMRTNFSADNILSHPDEIMSSCKDVDTPFTLEPWNPHI